MQIDLTPDIEAKLSRLAHDRGGDAQQLAKEAIERFVDYDDWFLNEVEKGLKQIELGRTRSHEEVGVLVAKLLANKKPSAQ